MINKAKILYVMNFEEKKRREKWREKGLYITSSKGPRKTTKTTTTTTNTYLFS